MRWIYDGKLGNAIYASEVRMAAAPTGLQESSWNVLGEGDTDVAGIRIEKGVITLTELVEFGVPGLAETLATTELRSPVRSGDQYTAVERNGLPLGRDIDGDKVNDKADIAGWSRVIGMEDVELPALQRKVNALRVDKTLAIRIQRSSDARYETAQWITQSSWYARDIGVVRRTLSAPGAGVAGAVEYDEHLRAWDGLTRGLGAMLNARPAQATSSYAAYPALKALALGDRALVLSGLSDRFGEQGLRLTVYDRSGQFLKTLTLPDSQLAVNGRPQFVNCGNEACLLTAANDSFGRPMVPRLLRFDREGMIQGPVAGTTLALGDYATFNYLAAGDAQGFWLMWLADTTPPGASGPVELRLQVFTNSGAARAAHQVLEPGTIFNAAKPLSLTGNGSRVTATWGWFAFPRYQYKYATASIGTGPTPSLLYESQNSAPGNSWSLKALSVNDGNLALLWPGTLFSNADPSSTGWRGLMVNISSGPVRSTADNPDHEVLPSGWIMEGYPMFAAHSGSVFMLSQGRGKLSEGSILETDLLQLIQITPGSSALTAATASRTVWPALDSFTQTAFQADQMLAFEDRVLMFGSNPNITGIAFRR